MSRPAFKEASDSTGPSCLNDFPWPKPSGVTAPPRWREGRFYLDELSARVLVYDASESHWSAELTELHEAEAGSTHPIDKASRRFAAESLLAHLSPNRPDPIILDVGCSSGYVIEEIRRAIPGATLIGSDYLLPPLEKLAARLPWLPLLQFDLRRCPLPDECVDAVTALNVLEHIDDDAAALAQIARILRRDGIAHVEVPASPSCYDIYDEQLMHHRRYRLGELLAKARAAGFEVLRATHLGFFLFPAFWFVKQRNRRSMSLPDAEKKAIVAGQIHRTSESSFLDKILRIEQRLGRWLRRYPCGIRCVVVLKKP